jgi:hypothetical protein
VDDDRRHRLQVQRSHVKLLPGAGVGDHRERDVVLGDDSDIGIANEVQAVGGQTTTGLCDPTKSRPLLRAAPDGNDEGMTTYTSPSVSHPGPVRWLWYTFGGRLGPLYCGWVLRDTTARTRWLRQAVRGTVQVVPAALLMLVVLPSGWLTWASIVLGLLLALWYSLAYINQTAERRLVKHGYEPGTLAMELRERYLRENEDGIARYMATYRHDLTTPSMVIAVDRMLDRFIDRWLRWQDEREARRREHWKRNMHRDQRFGIW